MDYVLIKNGILSGDTVPIKADILICEHKIIDIGTNLHRPTLDTPVIDAGGKFVLPGIIDINRNFFNLFSFDQHHLVRLLQSQIISGTTFWMDALTVEEMAKTDFQLKADGFSMPDYSFHLLVDLAFCHNPEKSLPLIMKRGISSLLIQWPLQENISDSLLRRVFDFASAYNLLLLFDFQFSHHYDSGNNEAFSEDITDFHLKELNMLSQLVKEYDSKACFFNVQYVEELQILKELRQKCEIYAELSLSVTLGSSESFRKYGSTGEIAAGVMRPIPADVAVAEVLANEWCLVGRSGISVFNEDVLSNVTAYNRPNDYFIFKYFLSVMSSIPIEGKCLTPLHIAHILATRPAKLFGLSPVKGAVRVGGDADLIIWDADYERNLYVSLSHTGANSQEFKLRGRTDFVFMKGRIIYNGEQILTDSVPGEYIFRYV